MKRRDVTGLLLAGMTMGLLAPAARADGGDNIESFELSTTGGTATLESLDVFDMRSIWSSETAPR